jgi:hypothetical protein
VKRALGGLLLLCACGGDDDTPADASSMPDAAPPADVAQRPIQAAETDGVLDLSFRLTAQGFGTSRIGEIDIAANAGTVEIAGRAVDAVVYVAPPPFPGYDLYQVLAVAPDALYLVWLYCNSGASTIDSLYWEGTDDHPLAFEPASGSCNASFTPTSTPVVLPALALPVPDLVQGFSIDGTELFYDGTPGLLAEPGGDVAFLPFDLVDCTVDCGTPGWWELHAILWDSLSARVGFGIVYLFDQPPPVSIAYEIWLPDLSVMNGLRQLDATWTIL